MTESIEEARKLRADLEQRLAQLRVEEAQLAGALRNTQAAVVAQEGAIQGLEILLTRLEALNNDGD